jgi:integrase
MRVWGLPRNPVVDVERPRYRVSDDLEAFSPEEVWALVRAAGSEQDAALFLAAAFTGLRMGELLALQWRDVDFAGEAIRVRRSYNIHGGLGTPKSGRVRSVPMVPDVAQALARLANREDFSATRSSSSPTSSATFRTPARPGSATRPPSRARHSDRCAWLRRLLAEAFAPRDARDAGPRQERAKSGKRSVLWAQVSAGSGSPRLWAAIRSLR